MSKRNIKQIVDIEKGITRYVKADESKPYPNGGRGKMVSKETLEFKKHLQKTHKLATESNNDSR